MRWSLYLYYNSHQHSNFNYQNLLSSWNNHTNSRPCLTHFFYFWSCSLKVLIFYLEWKFINWPWKPIFLIWKFKFQLLNLVPSVWNAPESIGKWSRQQTGAPFLAYCKDMKYLLFRDNKCEVHVYVYDRSFGLKVTLATKLNTTRWHFDGPYNVPVYIPVVIVFWG